MSMFVERRLRAVGRKIKRAKEDLTITEQQLEQLVDESDDARIRSLVADDPAAGLDYKDSRKHSDALARHREDLIVTIQQLEITQDELLDAIAAKQRGRT